MKKEKISFIKEGKLKTKADKEFNKLLEKGYAQNPITAKLLAFQKTKKDIKNTDFFK